MTSPLDVAWSVLKALPEDSLYSEEVSRTGSGAYGDPMLTPAVVQNRFQTMHPAIRGMMRRRAPTSRHGRLGRIDGASNNYRNAPQHVPAQHVPATLRYRLQSLIEDVPTIDMPYYPDEGARFQMGDRGDIGVRSGTGAPEHLPVDETTLASHTPHGGHREGSMDNFLDPIEQRGGRYPGGEADRAIRERGRLPLDVFRDADDNALREHLNLTEHEAPANYSQSSLAESFNIGSGLDPGTYPQHKDDYDGSKFERRNALGYGEGSRYGSGYRFDPEQFGQSIFDYDMRQQSVEDVMNRLMNGESLSDEELMYLQNNI